MLSVMFQMFKLVLEKRNQRSNGQHPLDHGRSKRVTEKKSISAFIDYAKAFDCVDHNKLWKILQEMGIPDHLTCLLRNMYEDQAATVRTGHGTTDWFQIGNGVHLGCWRRQWQPTPILLPEKSHEQRSLVGCSPWGRKE